ncbi:MAG: O-antigen ligase family protein, partial [Bdellovibrionaceae bacterium]|nr:O-antigen ligase family protein [Pseudobdellovibrionaceae bacterium]
VFGRWMGWALLAVVMLGLPKGIKGLFILLFAFALSWSLSRGAQLSFFLALWLGVLLARNHIGWKWAAFASLSVVAAIFFVTQNNIWAKGKALEAIYSVANKRENAIADGQGLQKGEVEITRLKIPDCIKSPPCFELRDHKYDRGSIWQRVLTWKITLTLLSHSEVFFRGLGLGRWGEYVDFLDMGYPHNLFLEAFSEMGFFLGLLFLAPMLLFLISPNGPLKVFALYFFLHQQVSGDMLDARFLLVFSVVSFILGKNAGGLNYQLPKINWKWTR